MQSSACTKWHYHAAGLPSVTEDAEATAAAPPPPVARLISPQPQAAPPAVHAVTAVLPVPTPDSSNPAVHGAPGPKSQAAKAALAAGSSSDAEDISPLTTAPPAAAFAQPPAYQLPAEQNHLQAHRRAPAAAQASPRAVVQPANHVRITPSRVEASSPRHQAATPAAATPQPQQPGQDAACAGDALATADTASTPQHMPMSPALSDASTVSIGQRPAARSVLSGSGDSGGSLPEVITNSSGSSGDGTAASAATPAAAAMVPAEQQLGCTSADRTAPKSALGTMMERAWSAAGAY